MQRLGGQSSSPTGSVNQPSVLRGRLQGMKNGAASERKDSQASSLHTHLPVQSQAVLANVRKNVTFSLILLWFY